MSTYVSVEISPATTTSPVVIRVSHATRPSRSSWSTASRTLSETWSAILSGWPSVTDSDVNRNWRPAIRGGAYLLDVNEQLEAPAVVGRLAPRDDRAYGPNLLERSG